MGNVNIHKKIVATFIIITNVLSLVNCRCYAKRLQHESVYQRQWCNDNNGITEFKLKDNTRVDCLTDNYAIEFDFADKWAECVGQATYYGIMTNRKGVCALIMENNEKDIKYLKRLNTTADKAGIEVYIIKP